MHVYYKGRQVNFDFSDDQKFLREEVRRFLAAACPPSVPHGVLNAASGHDAKLWSAIVEQGWLGAAIPEEHGGLGLGHLELCVIAEELGRAIAPVPFASTAYVLAEAIMLAGDERQQADYLPRIAAGTLIGCLASTEGPGHAPVQATVTGGNLTGTKLPVTDGMAADIAIVLAHEAGDAGLYLVDLDAAGVTREPIATQDPTRGAARIVFTQTPAQRLGTAGDGDALLATIIDRAAVLLAFEQIGGADRALEMARDYALERHAFGRPIGSYQAIKHKLADAYIKNALARANAYHAAWALNASPADLPIAAAAARIAATEAFWFAAKENIQTHGGIGFTWEMDCHLYYRRSRQLALVAGSPSVWKERLVSHLERRNAA